MAYKVEQTDVQVIKEVEMQCAHIVAGKASGLPACLALSYTKAMSNSALQCNRVGTGKGGLVAVRHCRRGTTLSSICGLQTLAPWRGSQPYQPPCGGSSAVGSAPWQ